MWAQVPNCQSTLLLVGSVALRPNAVERTLKPIRVGAQFNCDIRIDLRALILPEREKDDGAVNVRVAVTESKGNKAVELAKCFSWLVKRHEYAGPIVVDFSVFGVEVQYLLEVAEGLLEPLEPDVDH